MEIEGIGGIVQAMKSHTAIDLRSLAFGEAIVARLRQDPALVRRAEATLARWLDSCSPQVRPALLEWQSVIKGSRDEIEALLMDASERGVRLRQSNPFAGVLSQRERLDILRQFESHDTVAT